MAQTILWIGFKEFISLWVWFCFSFSFSCCWFFFILGKEREREREKRGIFLSTVYYSGAYNSQVWAILKLVIRNSLQISHMNGNYLSHNPRRLWSEVEPGFKLDTPGWGVSMPSSTLKCLKNRSSWKGFFFFNVYLSSREGERETNCCMCAFKSCCDCYPVFVTMKDWQKPKWPHVYRNEWSIACSCNRTYKGQTKSESVNKWNIKDLLILTINTLVLICILVSTVLAVWIHPKGLRKKCRMSRWLHYCFMMVM